MVNIDRGKVVFSGGDLHNTKLNWTGVDVCREKPLTVLRTGYRRVFSFTEEAEPIMKSTILNVTFVFIDRKWNNLNENLETWSNILICPILQYDKGAHTQMNYTFVYGPGVVQYII